LTGSTGIRPRYTRRGPFVPRFLAKLPAYERKPLNERVAGAPPGTLGLVDSMLAFDPRKRCPIAAAVGHACFDEYREEDLEARAGFQVEMDDVEGVRLEKKAIQKLLYDDIRAFHRSVLPFPRVSFFFLRALTRPRSVTQEPADRAPPPHRMDREDSLKTAISRDHLDDIRDALHEPQDISVEDMHIA